MTGVMLFFGAVVIFFLAMGDGPGQEIINALLDDINESHGNNDHDGTDDGE